ncbi:hypothetical protein EDB89DRAFT_2066443 [Lactarius sanguifluus]|nr:hypothetical protein EDB89DRAFT_2066443 [Lactarius sanguifluus]
MDTSYLRGRDTLMQSTLRTVRPPLSPTSQLWPHHLSSSEIYCYLRSPYRDLSVYDSVVQYDTPLVTPSAIALPFEFSPGRERRYERSPKPRALPRDDDTRRSTSPYSVAAAEDPSAQRGVRFRTSEIGNGPQGSKPLTLSATYQLQGKTTGHIALTQSPLQK